MQSTFRGVCLNNLYGSFLSEVKETDGAIATSQSHQVRLVGMAVHATQRHILTRTVCVCEGRIVCLFL